MKAVISIDSFKGSISTFEAAEAVREAFLTVYPDGEALLFPLADGGDNHRRAFKSYRVIYFMHYPSKRYSLRLYP